MVRLVTTNCFFTNDDEESHCSSDATLQNFIEVSTYFKFEEYSTFIQETDLKESLYSLNLVSKTYLLDEKFLIYINDYEYSICFNHKTIYSLKISGEFKLNDIIKSVLITKNLIMLLSAGEVNKIYFIIDSQYEELYKNILKENLKNEKGEETLEKLGDITHLVKKLPELETKKSFLFKYATIGILLFLSIYVTFGGLERISSRYFPIKDSEKIMLQIETEKLQLNKNKEILNLQNDKYTTLSDCITKDSK